LTVLTQGTILSNAGGTLLVNGSGGLTNPGTLQVDAGNILRVTSSFTNFSSSTLTGGTYIAVSTSGMGNAASLELNLGSNNGGEITTNLATIVLNGPQSNFWDLNGNNALSNLSDNGSTSTAYGKFTIENGADFSSPAGTNFDNSGGVEIGSGSEFSTPSDEDYVQTASLLPGVQSITQVDGTLNALAVNIGGGIISGTGTVDGPVTIGNGAAIQAGDNPGAPSDPPGTLTMPDLDLMTGATINETISGSALSDISLLNITGSGNDVTLPAAPDSVNVDLMLLNGFDPKTCPTMSACQFVFLTYAGTLTGSTVLNLTDPNIDPFGTFSVDYSMANKDFYLSFAPNMITTATPEPASFLPLAGLLACLAYGIRRREQGKQTA
jgi:hypothetical protein